MSFSLASVAKIIYATFVPMKFMREKGLSLRIKQDVLTTAKESSNSLTLTLTSKLNATQTRST